MDGRREQHVTRSLLVILGLLTLAGQILEAERAPHLPVLTMRLDGAWVRSVDAGGAAERAGIRTGDFVTGVGGPGVGALHRPRTLLKRCRAGEAVTLRLQRDDIPVTAVLVLRSATRIEILWRLAVAGVGIFTLLIGVLVYVKKPRRLTLIFAGVCYVLGYLIHPPYVPAIAGLPFVRDLIQECFTFLLPPLLVHLFLLFPFRHAALETKPRLPRLLYLPSVLLLVGIQGQRWLLPGSGADAIVHLVGGIAAGVLWVLGILTALWLFARSYRRAQTDVARAKVRAVLWGTVLGLLPVALVLVLHELWPGRMFPGDRLAVLSTVLIPLSFGYAIVRHGIFDATLIVRRSLGLTVGAILILAAYFGTYLFLNHVLRPMPEGTPLWVSFVSMLVAALVFLLFQAHRPALLANAAGTRRRDQQTLLCELGQSLCGQTQHDQLVRTIAQFTAEALGSERVAFFEKTSEGQLEAAYLEGLGVEELQRYRFSPNLSHKLEHLTEPTDRGDLETDLPFGYLSPADQSVLEALGTEIIVPLPAEEGLRGMISVGRQTFGEPYTSDDLQLVQTIAAEGSIALENTALHERVRQEEQWRREVALARDLQKRLLPNQLPQGDALEISGFSVPAKGVGGDYYDGFRNPWGEIVLVIGDASGKWAPGATLMANLQGLVKGEAMPRDQPPRIVQRINRRVCEMRKPERYITFCLARVDPLTGKLAYCNAGHPSPLLVRTDGRIEELEDGGLPLGIRPQATYDGGTIVMRSGDVLLLYTDGITERWRGREQFGEERLHQIARENRRLSARALQEAVLSAVQQFAPTPLDDDTTLLVAKML